MYLRCKINSRFSFVAVIILCLGARLSFAEDGQMISLSDYVYLALSESEQMLDVNEQMLLSDLDLAGAEYQFESRFVPIASWGSGEAGANRIAGVEWNKTTTFGTKFSTVVSGGVTESSGEEFSTTNSYIQISQNLFRKWGEKYNRAPLTKAEYLKRKKTFQILKSRQTVIKTAIQKYYQTLLSEKIVESAQRSFERAKENLEVSKSRQSVGLVSKSDVYRARIALLNSESSYKDQQRTYITRVEDLHEYVRLFEIGHLKPKSKIQKFHPVVPGSWDDAVLESNFDWASYQIDKQIAQLNMFKAERDMSPDLSLDLKYGNSTLGRSFSDDNTTSDTNWSVQLRLNSTIDMFYEKQSLAKEKIAIRRIERAGESLRRRIFRDIREGVNSLKAEDRRLRISDEKKKQSEKAFDLSRIRYERGLINNLELIEAENDLYNSDLENLQAQVGYNLASVDLAYVLCLLSEDWLEQTMFIPQDGGLK